MNSNTIHVAHALDATYFPYYIEGGPYTDHPYALLMGSLLNFYKNMNYEHLTSSVKLLEQKEEGNPTINLLAIFDVNAYIPIQEFEKTFSNSIVREGLISLFSELSVLNEKERESRIAEYNQAVDEHLSVKGREKKFLDLGEDTAGLLVPFLSTGKKLLDAGKDRTLEKFPTTKKISEYILDKLLPGDDHDRQISLLSRVNRVARLRRFTR